MIIGLVGLIGSGKDTVAVHLIERYGFTSIKFASVLKDMLRTFGLTENHIEGALKEQPCELLGGKTPRWAMQTLGTEWGRKLIDTDLWVRCTMHRLDRRRGSMRFSGKGLDFVISDCRFPNEARAITERGGKIWRVVRLSAAGQDAHASEAGQDAVRADCTIYNDGTVEALYKMVDLEIASLSGSS